MSEIEIIVLGVGVIGFGVGFVAQFMLKKHVSLEKVRAITDPSEIYPNCIPPKRVLTDKGMQIYKLFIGGIIVFIGSIVISIILGIVK